MVKVSLSHGIISCSLILNSSNLPFSILIPLISNNASQSLISNSSTCFGRFYKDDSYLHPKILIFLI